ncbi:glyoxylase-like metal-dependent hydrolase (beta-lactamase superfamily II) [Pelomonas saccharophila]|uniref:Glyoxylase-like metal-dependent hydrolase (Beta-lactamase superfamily II) n=1 Tax=Roseateles saccharophilus TaxID=304 RepID=A0ABU1YGF7_ROSSA|nr:MBL fold metallo-hydrolase [Roseateles saccharophilus]MDR7267908.1 glyoxylase-like metal-dependent hydrolase (beta-lactamase superfamily II) [Roseateles saccharophilus]
MPVAIQGFHEPVTGTVSYVVHDPATRQAAVIDPVLDHDLASGQTGTASADRLLAWLREQGLTLQWILETHVHADHVSAARYLRREAGGQIAIGEHIREVQATLTRLRGWSSQDDGFDRLLRDGESFRIGSIQAIALLTPGHTPADLAYQIEDAVFIGDTLFMPDVGSARADFPGGDAVVLYRSIRRLLDLPPATRLFVCHDYPPGREPRWQTSVAEQRAANIHAHDGISESEFVAMRQARDATLAAPRLMAPSLQANIRGGG